MVGGGQGRSDEEVLQDGTALLGTVVILAPIIVALEVIAVITGLCGIVAWGVLR